MKKCKLSSAVVSVSLMAMVLSVSAADRYWDGTPGTANGVSDGGDGTWSTSAANWDTGSGYAAWNSADDTAIFGTANSVVTLAEDIALKGIVFGHAGGANDNGSWQYTIQGYNLNFSAGGSISNLNGLVNMDQTIKSGITGEPDVDVILSSSASENTYHGLSFAPVDGAQQALGTVTLAAGSPALGGGQNKCCVVFGGSSTGNTIQNIFQIGSWSYFRITDACDWTLLGTSTVSIITMNSGDFKIGGKLQMTSVPRGFYLTGGTLHYNNPGALQNSSGAPLRTSPDAYIDNTSGAAITNSIYNPYLSYGDGLTFVGSQGTNSDLNIGSGAVSLSKTTRMTVINPLTTFTVGGIISGNGYGIVKYGAGTLRLTGANQYNGETLVYDGTLSLGGNSAIAASSTLMVMNGGKVNLETSVNASANSLYLGGELQAAGTWGSSSSAAANKNDTFFSGPGMLTVLTGSEDFDLLLRDDFESGLGNWTAVGASLFTYSSGTDFSTTTNSAAWLDSNETLTVMEAMPLAQNGYTNIAVSFNIKGYTSDRYRLTTRYSDNGTDFTDVGVTANFEGRVTFSLPAGTYNFTDAAKVQFLSSTAYSWADAYIDDVMITGSPAVPKPAAGTVISIR